ncbi:HD domain-containing protein [Microbacterium sp. CFH 31415]|uniref:HD domain-containing protein n=1 Tax=Microbacterium sp. CFH 31415 TaxID=2921732 RepID=UPI0035ABF1AF
MHPSGEAELATTLRSVCRRSQVPSRPLLALGVVEQLAELRALRGVPQDPTRHPEGDVLVHSLGAADAAARMAAERGLPASQTETLVLASLFHDVGKPATTTIMRGKITSHGHAGAGATIVTKLGNRHHWPPSLTSAVSVLVDTHMAHVSVEGTPSRRAVARLVAKLTAGGCSLEDWAIVVKADVQSRGLSVQRDPAEPWIAVGGDLSNWPKPIAPRHTPDQLSGEQPI